MSWGIKMTDDTNNITPEWVKAQEALKREGEDRLKGDTPAANVQGAKANTLLAQDRIHENDHALGNSEQSKRDKYAQLLGLTSKEITDNHMRFIENGFNSLSDLNEFGGMLGNDDYWGYLQDNPEEKQKLANEMVDGIETEVRRRLEAGEITASQIPEAIEDIQNDMSKGDPKAARRIDEMAKIGGINGVAENLATEFPNLKTKEQQEEYSRNSGTTSEKVGNLVNATTGFNQTTIERAEAEKLTAEADISKIDTNTQKVDAKSDIVSKKQGASGREQEANPFAFLDDEDKKADFEGIANNFQNSVQKADQDIAKNPSQEISKPPKSDSINIGNMV